MIFSHELGSTHRSGIPYAENLASHGIACYIFDFRGGGSSSRSDGATTEMSAMTEADDIEAILDIAREWDFIDSNKIALIGASQGGIDGGRSFAYNRKNCALSHLVTLLFGKA